MLLMIEEGGGICQAVYRYAKANTNISKIIIKALNHHISCI